MPDSRAARHFHLTLRMVWWGLVVLPLVGGATLGVGHGFQFAIETSLALSLGAIIVLVLAHVIHLSRQPACPRCLHVFDWLTLEREAHNAGMEPDAYMELVRPRRLDLALMRELKESRAQSSAAGRSRC
jgi:hypothetical protein